MSPRVEMLHVRDPDTSCTVRVWVDGVEVTPSHEVDIDPGRGYDRASWEEMRDFDLGEVRDFDLGTPGTASFLIAVVEAYEANGDAPWITEN